MVQEFPFEKIVLEEWTVNCAFVTFIYIIEFGCI